MAGSNQAFQKHANIALILKLIHDSGRISRVELSRGIGLRKSTVSNIINELLDLGIVIQTETGSAGTSGGRKPVLLSINPDSGCILGLEPRVSECDAVLYDLNGGIIRSRTVETGPEPFAEMFLSVYSSLEKEAGNHGLNILAVAAGVAGSIDPERGIIQKSITHGLEEFDYAAEIGSRIPVPVFFENDTNCAAWGELKNSANISRDFICLLSRFKLPGIGPGQLPGIGMGLIIRGEIYYGADFRSGEFGTNSWFEPGTEYIGMSRQAWDSLAGDEERIKILMTSVFRKLSVSMSLLNPGELILSGDMKRHRSLLPDILSALKDDSWFGDEDNIRRIRFSRRDSMEIAGGAADMVLSRLYSIPQLGGITRDSRLEWPEIFSRLKSK